MAIFRHHLRSELGALAGWGAGVALVTTGMAAAYGLIAGDLAAQVQQILAQLPPQMLQFLGGAVAMTTVSGWLNATVFSGFVPMLVAIWTALAVVGVVTSDADSGTLEFLLALPLRRWRLLAERWLSLLLQLALLYVAIWASTLAGLALIGQSADPGRLAVILALQFLAQVALAGMLLLLSLAFRDQVRAVLATVTGALLFLFIPVFVEPGSGAELLRRLTPFTYGAPMPIMKGAAFPWSDAALLLAWAAAGFALALTAFTRQEV